MEAITQPTLAEVTAQVRAHLHHVIDETDNIEVLQALLTILDTTQSAIPLVDEAVRLEDLSPAERAAVEEGLRDIEAGRVRPHAEVWAEITAEFGPVKA